MRRVPFGLRYHLSMRTARRAYRRALDRGGRNWSREELYQRVRGR